MNPTVHIVQYSLCVRLNTVMASCFFWDSSGAQVLPVLSREAHAISNARSSSLSFGFSDAVP